MSRFARKLVSAQTLCLAVVALLLVVGLLHMSRAYGDQLPARSLMLSKAAPGAVDTYSLGFTVPNNESLGSIRLDICAEGPLAGTPCTAPSGLDMSAVTLGSQSGALGFSVLSATANSVILTRAAAPVSAGTTLAYELRNITDPSSAGSYFGRIETHTSIDGSGTATDFGGLAFAINTVVQVSATVPPYLYFCVGVSISGTDCATATGDQINFGDFSPVVASVADSQMVAGTNADTGYSIVIDGLTLTSGTNVIPELDTPDVSRPGTSQFGINLVANTDPQVGNNPSGTGVGTPATGYNQTNRYKFTPDDDIVVVPLPDEPRNYTVSYLTNVAKSQPAGIYVSTMTYVATGGF